MARILVTGATGFIGRELCTVLTARGHEVVAAGRHAPASGLAAAAFHAVDLMAAADWQALLGGCDTVIHLAAAAHFAYAGDLKALRALNVDATRQLASAALHANVRRFIFLSTAKVHGEETIGTPFSESVPFAPSDPYAVAKCDAESALRSLFADAPDRLTVVRPPLVYGPGVKANFLQLVRLVGSGLPLPLASIDNRRSLIALTNLSDFLAFCVETEKSAGGTFLISDGKDLSTPDLLHLIGIAIGRPARLFPCPVWMLW